MREVIADASARRIRAMRWGDDATGAPTAGAETREALGRGARASVAGVQPVHGQLEPALHQIRQGARSVIHGVEDGRGIGL